MESGKVPRIQAGRCRYCKSHWQNGRRKEDLHLAQRIRVVIVNGKKEEQIYEVAVPVRTRRYDVTNLLTVQDSRRHEFAIDQVEIWDVQGKSDLPRCEVRDNHS